MEPVARLPDYILPKHPYTADEIEEYVDQFFVSTLKDKARKEEIKKRVTHYMQLLPAWVQVLMIEARHAPIQIGPVKALRMGNQVVGFAEPHTKELKLAAHLLYGDDQEFEFYLSHEIAHNIDIMLGKYRSLKMDGGGPTYLSEMRPSWTRHLKQDLKLKTGRSSKDLNRQVRAFLEQGKYKPEEYPREGFAFLMSHYLIEHFRANHPRLLNDQEWCAEKWSGLADEASISSHIEKFFPKLWPFYRDYIVPDALELATKYHNDRHVRRMEANHHVFCNMESAMNAVALKYGTEPPQASLIHRLASSYYSDWLNLFEQLAEPLPSTPKERLNVLFPSVFDAVWGAHSKSYTLRDFPHLKNEAKQFAQHVPDIIRDEGIEVFVGYYQKLWSDFDEAIQARNKPKARAR